MRTIVFNPRSHECKESLVSLFRFRWQLAFRAGHSAHVPLSSALVTSSFIDGELGLSSALVTSSLIAGELLLRSTLVMTSLILGGTTPQLYACYVFSHCWRTTPRLYTYYIFSHSLIAGELPLSSALVTSSLTA